LDKSHPQKKQARFLLFWFTIGYLTGSMNYLYLYGICLTPAQPFASYGVSVSWAMLAYAVFAYRIFDARLVIRKSLVYSLLVTILTVGYFGFVYSVETIFRSTFGYQSFTFSLVAFALMALFFQPIKIGIQRIVDWLVFRSSQEHLVKKLERLEEQALQTEKFKAVSTLAAGMAHEIKNPLTTLKTFTKYIPEKRNDPEFLQKLHEVYTAEVNRIQAIVKDLLEFSKPRPPELKPVDIGPLIVSTVNLLSSDLLKRRIQWTIDCRHNGSTPQADVNQLRQVLINLIQNAADAMPAGGQLKIATRSVNGHLELIVSDTGSGISSALLPKIFDPFITTKSDGNGLGLAVVYSIIQAHHGSVRADSPPGRGTTFTVSLPL
jgi:signal transduction histidine kinase